ncbi:MAG: protein kinase [Candidatus Eisenbacteria bacterium]
MTPPPASPDPHRTVAQLATGQRFLGRYSLKKVLGRGGFGVVWLAHDDELEMDVAIKFLSDLIVNNPEAIDDLKRETRYSLRLTHPNIMRIYGFLQGPDLAGVSMEYVDGGTLSALKIERPNRCFDADVLAPLVAKLCDALFYAHTRVKVAHRELKPGNLMVDSSGDLKVADFGISRSISDTQTALTQAGTSGTPAYMSPQQMMGERSQVTDDIYSLGATLYDLLAGKPPFYQGNVVEQVRSARPISIAQRRADLGIEAPPVPAGWETVIASCLEKRAEDRPQSAAEVAARLDLPVFSSWRESTPIGTPRNAERGLRDPDVAGDSTGQSPGDATVVLVDRIGGRSARNACCSGILPSGPRRDARGGAPGTAVSGPGIGSGIHSRGAPSAAAGASVAPARAAAPVSGRPDSGASRGAKVWMLPLLGVLVLAAAGWLTLRPGGWLRPSDSGQGRTGEERAAAVDSRAPTASSTSPTDRSPGSPSGNGREAGGDESVSGADAGTAGSGGSGEPIDSPEGAVERLATGVETGGSVTGGESGPTESASGASSSSGAPARPDPSPSDRGGEPQKAPTGPMADDYARAAEAAIVSERWDVAERQVTALEAIAPADKRAQTFSNQIDAGRRASRARDRIPQMLAEGHLEDAEIELKSLRMVRPDDPGIPGWSAQLEQLQAQQRSGSDSDAIQALLREYHDAFSDLDLDRFAELFVDPGSTRNEYGRAFRDLASQNIATVGEPAIEIDGGRATVRMRDHRRQVLKVGQTFESDFDVILALQKAGDRWKIRSAETKLHQ